MTEHIKFPITYHKLSEVFICMNIVFGYFYFLNSSQNILHFVRLFRGVGPQGFPFHIL